MKRIFYFSVHKFKIFINKWNFFLTVYIINVHISIFKSYNDSTYSYVFIVFVCNFTYVLYLRSSYWLSNSNINVPDLLNLNMQNWYKFIVKRDLFSMLLPYEQFDTNRVNFTLYCTYLFTAKCIEDNMMIPRY